MALAEIKMFTLETRAVYYRNSRELESVDVSSSIASVQNVLRTLVGVGRFQVTLRFGVPMVNLSPKINFTTDEI